jgi:Trp operon repressor
MKTTKELIEELIKKGMDQRSIATGCGVNQSTISRCTKEAHNPSFRVWRALVELHAGVCLNSTGG